MPDHGQPHCKQQLCCCHILTQPFFGGRAGSLLSHSHGLLNKEEQKWPQATCLMGHKHGIAGSRESSQDPGRPKDKPSILLNKSCARKILEKTSPSCLFRCYLLAQADRDHRRLWVGHWRGNPACLALWLLHSLQIMDSTPWSSVILRPALGGPVHSPGGSKGQLNKG